MLSPDSLQAYIRKAAALTHDVVEAPPFLLFFNPNDDLRFYNYGVPAEPVSSLPEATVASLRTAFAAHKRLLRFEFIAEAAPGLAAAFAAAGLVAEGRNPLLVCHPETFRPAPPVAGLEIRPLHATAPLADLRAFITTQARGFAETETDELGATEAQGEELRQRFAGGGERFLALLAGQPVAAGAFTAPLDGYTELVGIATLAAYRRRGIASALTATMTQAAFAAGVEVAFLSAADEQAGRVYERVGFKPYATALAYCQA